MKKLKKILSVLALIVLVGSDFLTSISYALDDMLDDSVVVQIENEEAESVENEEENVDKEDSETVYEDENMEEEKLETENSAGDIIEEWTGEVSEIGSGEVKELAEETVEGITGDLEGVTGDVEELTGEVVESTEIGEETVIEDMTYNEEPITGEKTYNDVTVRVEALTGIFPEGTELNIEPIKWWNLSSLKDKLVEEKEEIKEDTTIVAFDITFRYEGEEVQPKDGEKVKVTFDYSRNEDLVKADKNENQEVKVYHIENKDEEGNEVAQGEEKVVDVTNKEESAEEGIAVADADSFSVYVVTYGNEDPEFSATLVGADDDRNNNFHYKTITISDGEHTYTLMDRNLGARVAWNTGAYEFNTISDYDSADDYYGYYYQRGNNYGFTAKTTQVKNPNVSHVLSNAIPSNYVDSSWRIFNLDGYNLRGDTTDTESARQGPCPRGWHVPSIDEWTAIRDAWCVSADKGEMCQNYGQDFAKALQMPTAGYYYYNYGKFTNTTSGSNGYYWSSTSNDNLKANFFFLRSSGTNPNISPYERLYGFPVRCLMNNTDAVTLYLNPNGGRVENAIIDADAQGKVILPTATRNEYVFKGWFTSAGESEKIGDAGDEITINEDTDLYAHWAEIIPNPIVKFNNGADVTEIEVENGGTLTSEQIQQVSNLTHTKATFDGWYTDPEFNQTFDLNTPITADTSLYAKWTCNGGYIQLQGNGGPDMNCFEYGTMSYEDNDGNEHIIMDRNLGATMTGYGVNAEMGSYGYYYQWGNNYGFGPLSSVITSNTQVDCTNINPSTYSSSTFVIGSNDFDWCSSKNDNLWGGSEDGSGNNRGLDTISTTAADRQGPCPDGWHVPSIGERETLLIYGASLNSGTRKTGIRFYNYEMSFSNFIKFTNDFKLPIAGQRAHEGAQLINYGGGGSVNLWSSSPDVDYVWARHFNMNIPTFEASTNARNLRAYGFPVRCFMNELKNTLTLNAGGGTVDLGDGAQSIATTGIVKGESFTVPTATRTDHSFDGWFVDANENGKYDDGEVMMGDAGGYIIDSMDDNLTLTAKWKVTITYDGNGGTSDKELDFGQPGDEITLSGATQQGKVFGGWNNGTGYVGTQGDKYTLTRTETLLAQYYDYVVTFVYGNGERSADPIFLNNGDDDITLPSVSSVSGYIFDGWYDAPKGGNKIGDVGDSLSVNESRTLYAQGHYNSVELTDDNTTTTVGSGDVVDEVIGFPITMTVIENDILESPEGEELSELEGKELAGDITIDFGGVDAKFSHLVKVKIPVKGSSKAYVKVKHVSSESYNYDGLTRNIEASCNDGNIENSDDMYTGAYIDVEDGYVSIYTCEASNFAAFGLPKVIFEPNNGDDPIIVEVESGATVDNGDIPIVSNSGLDFAGWYLTGAESAFDFSGTAITGDITLYAKWQEDEGVTYTVSFDANRGTFADTPASQNVLGGGHATDPAMLSGYNEPKLPGYAFTGWWTEPRGGTQWNFANDTVTGNITLYAHWTYKEIFGDLDVYMIDSNGSLIKYVMMDRNMGATGVYNKNFDSQNPNSFGFVYQWGNNYGFPRCNGNATCNYSPITDTPVSVDIVENYIPSKFASSTWIGKNGGNSSRKSWHSNSGNVLKYLWGNGNTIDMQGPCPDGYHVPLTSETNDEGGLFRVWGDINDKTINTIQGKGSGFSFLSDDQELFSSQFLFPHAGNHKKGNTKEQEQNMCGDYWTATPSGLENAINIWFCKDGDNNYYDENGKFLFTNNSQRNNGSTLRCFKNSTDSANLDIVNGGKKGLITVEKVGGVATINAIKEPENTDANGTGLIFGGWYTSQNFEPSTMKTGGDTLSASVTTLYAKWDCPDGLVYNSDNECISGVLVRFMDEETEYTRSVVLSGEEVRAPATNPKKAGYIFTGWFEYGAELPFVFTGTPITGNLDLYAHWDVLPQTEALITVNYYLKKLDVENNELTGGVIVYSTGVEFIGEIGDTLNISGTYLTGIVGYQYDHATVFSGEDEILEDEIYLEGNKEVNMYYIPEQNQFTLNTVQYSNTDGSSVSGMYYYGAKVILSGSSSDDHYLWSGWIGLPEGTPNSAQTEFYMPNKAVTVTSSVREKIYDVYTVTFKNRNGDFLWSGKVVSGEMPTYSGSTPSRSSTEQVVYNFNGWYPELSPVTGNITYTATYTESPRLYTITLTGTPAGYGTLSTGSLSKEYETAIVISGSQLTIGGTEVILTGNGGYEFQEWTGTCGYVERPICNENIIYTHPGVIEFTGSNNLIIRNPGYDLFSEANFHKDFEISFNILNLDLKNSVNQATLISVKNEDLTNVWPGFTVRRGSATNYQITANGGIRSAVTVNRPAAGVNSLKIKRKNNILYISENDGEDIQIYNYTGFSDSYYFDNPIAIGSIYKEQTGQRYIKATLSDIVIKSMDTSSCSSGLVLAVTGDCQMTAVFSASDEYSVRIASNNAEYGTVSSDSVTKPYGTTITESGNTLNIGGTIVTATTGTAPAGHTYTFSGWTFSSECENEGNYAVAEGCTITGNFEETLNTYTVTFDLSGGSLTGDMTLTKEYTIETPTISLIGYEPERNGYTFTGWYRDGTLVTSMAGGETGDYTLIARWEAQERPIPVVVFMKMLVPGEYTDYDSNLEWGWGTVGELYTAPIEQFTHTGFYYEEDNENNVRSVIVSPNVDNEVHLYFSRIPYPLIITNAGEGISSTTTGGGDHLYEEPVTISVTPYTGWDFVSWSLSQGTLSGVNDLTQRTLSFNMPAEQVMISPILNHIEYTLSFDSASGTAVENQTYYYNDLLSGLDNAITTRTGYDFSGWYLSGVLYTSGSTMPAEDITLTAVWDINEYEIDASVATGGEGYLSGMGSTGISLTGLYDYATELVFIAIPELGYVFDYWKNGDTVLSGTDLGDGTNQLTVVVDQILDIIAFFKPADDTPYTVEHYQANVGLTGYDFVWSGTMYGTTNTQTNATGTDYEGFSLHNGNISEYQTGIKADGSTVVKLYYDRNRYIVTWNTWNGHEVTRTDVAYGQHPHFYLTPPERDILDQEDEDYDFTFTGWTRSGVSRIVDLETEIVTGDITYTAEYDRTLKYYTVKYYPGEGTGIMPDQTNLQLHTSGNLIKNTFTRTGYIFSGRYSSMGLRYEDEQEINMGRADGFEYDLSGNFFLSLEAQWKPSTDTKVTVNYYLKNLDVENNVLTGGSREYLTGVEFTGTADSIIDSILTAYGTGINGYEYSKSIVYGSDYPSGIETGTTTVLADGSRVIDMYYVPSIYQFTLNSESYSSTAGSSKSTGYYYGARVTLSGDSNDDCFTWSGWTTSGIVLSDATLQCTSFAMPANVVSVSPSVKEKTYDVTFNGGDDVQGSMENLSGVMCTENITLNNNFSKTGHTFTGWSITLGGVIAYTSGQVVSGLSKTDGYNVSLYAIWDINSYDVNAIVATGQENMGYLSGNTSTGVSLTGLYEYGKELVFIAVPEIGYLFDYWEVNGKTGEPEGAEVTDNQLRIVVNQILDIVAHFTENEKTVTVNYYQMDTGGLYSNEPYYTDSLTGLVGQTKFINPESRIGFHLDDNRSNTGVTISENSENNVINIYYERERYVIETSGRRYQMPTDTYVYFVNIIPDNQPHYQYYYGEEIEVEYLNPEGWNFSGWFDATSEGKGFPSDEVSLDSRNITFHMPDHNVLVEPIIEHIPYTLSFTGYEGVEVTNFDYCSFGTGDRETYYDYSECLPYLNKEGYWFNGWDDENGNWVRRLNDYSQEPILNRMPAHDYKLVANFDPRNDMSYEKYYYLQDIEGTGYTLSGDLTDRGNDGITNQEMPGREPLHNIEGFQYSGFGYSGVILPRDQWPIIKPTGDNYINYYYDRKVYLVNVNYDNKIMSITGAGEYRYETPVTLTATANTGYSFSGFTSYQGELLSSGSVYNFTMPDSFVDIYADANPIEYSIEYELDGAEEQWWWYYPKTYTVEDSTYNIQDPYKDGYAFLGWTGGVISGEQLSGLTKNLEISQGSVGNRKYFANFEATGSNVTVNYYLKKIDPENNVLTGGVDEYISKGVVYTGLTDSVVDISALYGTGIEGYEYTTAIIYGSDLSGGIETGTTTILGDGSRSIDIYYTPKKYNFTVIQGQNTTTSGTSISTGYYFGAYVTLSGDSSDDCFGWDKWGSTDLPEGKNQQYATFEMPAHNVTVESMVSEKSYNIVFDANGGTGTMSTLSVQCTTGTLSPNNFERNGYTFTGWSRNSGGPVEFSGGSNIHRLSTTSGGEVSLFAIWDFNEYTVTGTVAEGQENMGYLSGSTATGSSLTGLYDYGTELIFIAVPELGYLFDYWEVNGGTGDNLPDGVSISENQLTVVVDQILDIIAHFTENAKNVTVNYYEMNTGGVYPGVTNSTTFTGLVGHTGYATINIPYGFHLDTTQTTSTGIVISNNDSENVIDVYYARNQHQLNKFYSGDFQHNYDLIHLNPVLKQYYYYGEHIYTKVTVQTGYSVDDLTCSGGDNINIHGTEIEFDMGDEDATIIIDGSKNRYRIDYYLDGGIENPAEPNNITGYTINDGFIQIHDPIKTGYNFLGWTGGMSGDWISTPTSGLVIDVENGLGDRKYYANWELKPYIVNVIIDPEIGGTVRGTGEYHYGETFSLMATPNLGYDFTGWYTYEGYNKISDDYQIGLQGDDSGGTGLIAKFELRNYLVHISSTPYKGSSRPQGDNYYQHGSLITVTAEPYEGYNVKNWMVNGRERKTGDNERYTGLTLDMTITDPTNIDIDFEPKPYNITYMSGDTILTGLSPNTYDIETPICDVNYYNEYGTCMYYLPTLTRDGYDFTGWYNNPRISSYDRIKVLSGMGDRIIYAGFIPTTYRVYYHLGSGETLPEWYIDNYDEYTIESGRTYLPEPKKQGYDFLGWKDDNNQIITGFGGGMTGNLDLYPIWTGKVMDIEVRYYEMDINGNYNYYTHYDYTGITNSVFNVPDYTTTGFILDGTMHPSGNPSIVVSGNNEANIIDVYYEREEYEIATGVSEHGSVSGETGSQRYGKVITFIAHPEIGYILDKWFKNGEEIEGETGNELTQTVEEGMEISGHFIAATGTEYKVEYYYQNTEDGSYSLSATSGEIRKGTTDTIAEVMTGDKNPTMSGYSFDSENEKNVLSGNINGSGDLVLKIYFKKQFIVKYLTGSKGLFDIEIYEGLDYNGDTPEFGGNTGDRMPGYIFNGWLPEIKTKVTGDVQYVAQWIANTGTEYRVEYYKQNLGGTGYEVWTGIQYGTSDTQGIAEEKYYTGFTYNSGNQNNITSGVIAGDGSLVLKLFYDRNKYTITWKDGNNETLKTEQIFYGAIPVYSGAIPTKTATAQYTYTFNDTWSPNIEPVTTGAIYSAQFDTTVNKYLIIFKDGDGNVIQSGMVAYGDTPVYTGATPTKTATAQYSYTFNNTRNPSIEFVTTGVSYIAQFDPSVNSYSVNIVSSNTDMGTISTGKINVEYGSNIVESGNKITIGGVEIVATPNLADVQYTYEFDNRTNTCGLELVGTCTIQANFKKTLNKYTITWKDDNGNVIDTTMVEYGIIPTHAKPTKAETEDYRYIFVGWMPELTGVVGNAEYTAVFNAEAKEKPSRGNNMSGGGGRGKTWKTEDFDNQDKADLNGKNLTGDIDKNTENVDNETLSLYEWARQNNITTMNTLEEANPDGLLTRGHMAKMVVNFAQNVLGRDVPTAYPDKCNWKDKESDRESVEIKEYAKKACALGLMGIYVEEFMPNKILDRAEFGTVISRLLWGDKYNVTDTYHRSYFEDHLRLLKKNGILTQIKEPEDRWEIRKWVWLVFRRIEEKFK